MAVAEKWRRCLRASTRTVHCVSFAAGLRLAIHKSEYEYEDEDEPQRER